MSAQRSWLKTKLGCEFAKDHKSPIGSDVFISRRFLLFAEYLSNAISYSHMQNTRLFRKFRGVRLCLVKISLLGESV